MVRRPARGDARAIRSARSRHREDVGGAPDRKLVLDLSGQMLCVQTAGWGTRLQELGARLA